MKKPPDKNDICTGMQDAGREYSTHDPTTATVGTPTPTSHVGRATGTASSSPRTSTGSTTSGKRRPRGHVQRAARRPRKNTRMAISTALRPVSTVVSTRRTLPAQSRRSRARWTPAWS